MHEVNLGLFSGMDLWGARKGILGCCGSGGRAMSNVICRNLVIYHCSEQAVKYL